MARQGIELAISTLIIMVLAILLLIGLAFMITGGFSRFKEAREPLIDASLFSTIREACQLSCTTEDEFAYCCNSYSVDEEKVSCLDSRVGSTCAFSCAAVNCPVS